jgi:hypothetical protein
MFGATISHEQETPMSSYGSIREPDQLYLGVGKQRRRSARIATRQLPEQRLMNPALSDEARQQPQEQEESDPKVDADDSNDGDAIEILEMISSPGPVTKGFRSAPNLTTSLLRPPASESFSPTLETEHNGSSSRSGSIDPGSPPTSEPGPISSEYEREHSFEVIVFPRGLQRKFDRDRDPAIIVLDTASVTDLAARGYVDKLKPKVVQLAEARKVVGIGGEIVEIKEFISVGLEWHRGQFREYHKFYILEGDRKFQLLWGSKTIVDKHILMRPELGGVCVITGASKNKISPGKKSPRSLPVMMDSNMYCSRQKEE